jgi:hypothetical protein
MLDWARKHDVGELFLGVGLDLSLSGDLPWVRDVVRRARVAGIRVSALGGDPDWVDRHPDALAWVRSVVNTGLFDGVHLDVEPWARDDWEVRRPDLVTGYLELLRRVADVCPLPLEADIAFWLHEVPSRRGTPLDAAVMRVVDAVTVLSYRNTATGPDSITEVGATALATAKRVGVPCRLAVETRFAGEQPEQRKQTFHGLPPTALESALRTVDRMETSVSSYNGLAVHDLAGWTAL